MLAFAAFPVLATDLSAKEAKAKIVKIAASKDPTASIKFKDGTVLSGEIRQPGDRDFIFMTRVRAQAFDYSDVVEIKPAQEK
jgi:hypothetical protein